MNELSRRSSLFLVIGAALAILAARGIGSYAFIVSLIMLLGLGFRVRWFASMLLAFWILLSVPFLTALGESGSGQDRLAVLFLIFMTLGIVRLIAEVREASNREDPSDGANAPSMNGKVKAE